MTDAAPTTLGWTDQDADAAEAEGWAIFESEGSDNGPWQIQALDDPEAWPLAPAPYPFGGDGEVWEHVVSRAAAGSALHQRALNVIKQLNPMEYSAMAAWHANASSRPA